MKRKQEQGHQNMVSLLAKRSMKAGWLRNLIAVIAITLTAVLFTSVTTIGLGMKDSVTLSMQMMKMSKSDAEARNLSKDQYDKLTAADFIKEAGFRMPVGMLTNADKYNVELNCMDETQMELTFAMPSKGKVPKEANELVTSDRALEALGVKPEVGARVTIEFTAHGKDYQLPMVVSGWYEAISEQISTMVVGKSFVEAYPDIFEYTYDVDNETAGSYFSDFTVKSTAGLQEKLDDFVLSLGGSTDMKDENHIALTVNTITNPQINIGTFGAMILFVLLFIFCGYLLIYNVFDISVMQDIRKYGLYRTVGMSKKQVRKLINRQAVWLSCIGIPLGLCIGYIIGKGALPQMMEMFATEYSNISTNISPSPFIFIGAAVLTAFTVFISTRKPVRTAANISPVEAFRYVEGNQSKKKKKKGTTGINLYKLAWENLGRNKRRTIFIIISLALCIILLNSAGTAAGSVDIEKQVAQMIRTDFAVVNQKSMNNIEGFSRRSDGLSEQNIQALSSLDGITDGSAVYKNTLDDLNVTYDIGMKYAQIVDEPDGSYKNGITKLGLNMNLGTDEYPIGNVYGMEKAALKRMKIVEGETNFEKLYQELKNGTGVLVGVQAKMGTTNIDETWDYLQIGDTVTARVNGTEQKSYKVLAKAALNGDDIEIGTTAAGSFKVGNDGPSLYFPAAEYVQIYKEPAIYKYSFNAEKGTVKELAGWLDHYIEQEDTNLNYLSALSARESAQSMQQMISFVGSLVGIIFGIAGVLNLINTLITSIITRRLEFATMQSLGMTTKQLQKMMKMEGIYYALFAAVTGTAFAMLLDTTIVKGLCNGMWNFTFHLTLIPALAASLILVLLSVIIPPIALKTFNKGSIVEKLRITE